MTGYENPETIKRRNARPDRMRQRSTLGNMWMKNHPEVKHSQVRGIYAQMIDDQRNPITIELNNVCLAGDFHVPFTDERLMEDLFHICEEHQTKDLIIGGDFWDCDNYSRFLHLTTTASFQEEIEEVKKELKRLLSHFDRIWFCRGNHEKRWCDLNAGKVGMNELFRLAIPGNISEDEFGKRVTITTDDHIHLIQNGQLWLICHPKNFRVIPLSVAQDLAAKHLCNVVTFHGHTFRQGRDRSGQFRIAEGGGLFDRDALDYLRETSCHPMTRSGFYILKNGVLHAFEG